MRATPETDNFFVCPQAILTAREIEFVRTIERQRDDARDIGERSIHHANTLQGEVLALRKSLAAAEAEVGRLTKMIDEMVWPDDGGPASEKSLLDWFAGMALQGLLASGHFTEKEDDGDGQPWMTRHEDKYDDETGDLLKFPEIKFDFPEAAWRCAESMLSYRNGKGGA